MLNFGNKLILTFFNAFVDQNLNFFPHYFCDSQTRVTVRDSRDFNLNVGQIFHVDFILSDACNHIAMQDFRFVIFRPKTT